MYGALGFMFLYFHFTFLSTVLLLLLMHFLRDFCCLKVMSYSSSVNLFCVTNSSILFLYSLSCNMSEVLFLSAFAAIN
jgi:hypothetical protein